MAKTGRAKHPRSGRHPLVTLLIYCAMALVASAFAVGLHVHSGVALMPSVLLGLVLFLVVGSSEFVIGRARRAEEALERIEHIEAALAEILREKAQLDDLAKSEIKTGREVDELGTRLSTLERLAEEYAEQVEEQASAQSLVDPRQGLAQDAEIRRLGADLERLDARVEALRSQLHIEGRNWQDRITSELKLLETLVKQVAERMARGAADASDRDRAVTSEAAPGAAEPTLLADDQPSPADRDAAGETLPDTGMDAVEVDAPDPDLAGTSVLDAVRRSIESNRIDLYLQPIVTLPQRKVRYYEALTRLRDDAGVIIMPAEYLQVAESAGMMPLIDNIMLFRSVQVLHRLGERSSARGVFCNISVHSLVDAEFFPEFISFMDQNRSLADSLTFEFGQDMIKGCGPIENESLQALASLGFSFSLDHVHDLDVDFRDLHERNFRFVKIDADIFLNRMGDAGARIHPADMRAYLERFGLELIIEKVEDERSLASVLDHDAGLAQGYLFSEPRPVRPEVYGPNADAEAA